MSIYSQIDIYFFSIMLLLFLLVYYAVNASRQQLSARLFIIVLVSLMLNNFLAGLAWVPNLIDAPWAISMNYWSNAVFLTCNFLPIIAWLMYLDYKIIGDRVALKRRFHYYMIPFYITVVMMIVNHFTGWVFTIEAGNAYTRQIGVYVIGALTYAMLLIMFIVSRKYKQFINGRVLNVIFWFFLIPILGGLLQLFFFGLTLTWPSFAFATLMAFILIEKETLTRDALTNLWTRGQLEQRIKQKLRRGEPFSLIMIDLDHFKQINDRFGHDEGDKALLAVASILEHSVKRHDMVCRYGGDEFIVLIESDEHSTGRVVRQRIEDDLEVLNEKQVLASRIGMSFGAMFVGAPKVATMKRVLSEVDALMYKHKERTK